MKVNEVVAVLNNSTTTWTVICMPLPRIRSGGFLRSNPLNFPFSLLLLQISLSSAVTVLVYRVLKPLGQPAVISQIFGGILLGPSLLGLNSKFTDLIFPSKGFILIDALSHFGYMLYVFLIGVQVDPWIMKEIDKNAFLIGVAAITLPMVLSLNLSILLKHFVKEEEVAKQLPLIAQVECAVSFPMIAYFLVQLRIINTEFGRLALSASIVSNLCSILVVYISVLVTRPAGSTSHAFGLISNLILLTVIVLSCRLALTWLLRSNPDGEPLKQEHIIVLLLTVFVTGFCSDALGFNTHLGPLALGILLPAGPPVGSTLMEKIDMFNSWVFMPLYFLKNGLVVDVFTIELKRYFIIQSIAFMSAFGKFTGTFLTSLRCQIPKRDAVLLGLVMSLQGALELGLFESMRYNKVFDKRTFVNMCMILLLTTAIVTLLITYLYDPSRRYVVYSRRTVMDLKPGSELRILVCIHEEENVPMAINIIKALNPTNYNPIAVSLLHLIELAGRANPLLIPHTQNKKPSSKTIASEFIVKAFKHMEFSSHGKVLVFPFTSISPYATMYDDVCSIALDKRTSLILVPFHTRFHANGTVESTKRVVRVTNQNILHMAPCSFAILVDRVTCKTSRHFLESGSSYHVAVLFLGGADDREALALGERMAGHPSIRLTIIRVLVNGNITSHNKEEESLDNEVMTMFQRRMAKNYRVSYTEETVMDASGTIAVILSMENCYELVIVGRRHDNQSPLVSGISTWKEHRELGVLGDMLASADFMGDTTILVVQQHTMLENESYKHQGLFSKSNRIDKEARDISMEKIV